MDYERYIKKSKKMTAKDHYNFELGKLAKLWEKKNQVQKEFDKCCEKLNFLKNKMEAEQNAQVP